MIVTVSLDDGTPARYGKTFTLHDDMGDDYLIGELRYNMNKSALGLLRDYFYKKYDEDTYKAIYRKMTTEWNK